MTYPGPQETTNPYGVCVECGQPARYTCGICQQELCAIHMPEGKRSVSSNAVMSGRFHKTRSGHFAHPDPRF